ncbi:MAG: S8 family serine peptidase [Firmicutes bacterium]|nr:S8 family serine peptidase [Bacillota bacterium]
MMVGFTSKHLQTATDFYAELLYQVEDENQANLMAETYQIDLMQISQYGVASYAVTNLDAYIELQNEGFSQNSTFVANQIDVLLTHDTFFKDQYALDMMEIEQAWLFTEGSPDVTIAIIDSGIDIYHPEFDDRLSPISYNARTKQVGLNYVIDDSGHGTSVTGVIGAIKDNFAGIAGIVQNSTLLIIKANNEDNPDTTDEDESKYFSETAIIDGIYYAVDHGADVINMSFGGSYANPLTRNAIDYARSMGVILVAASGNDESSDLLYPASFEGVISVSAVDESREITYYSNYGTEIDVAAPGHYIMTTAMDNEYGYASGTSLAAPQVTGVIGLLVSYFPNEPSNQIIDRILYGAVDEGTLGRDDYYGWGIVNAKFSMNIILEYVTVSFETNGGTLIDPLEIYSGQTVDVENPFKVGYSFSGWYKDSLFLIPFQMGVDMITVDTTLYAKFTPNFYTVHFVTAGSPVEDIQVPYGQTFDLPDTSQVGYSFVGWYIDSNYKVLYNGDPITNDLILFASFVILMHRVTLYVNDEIFSTIYVQDGETFVLIEPSLGDQMFIGWFLDPELMTPFIMRPLLSDLFLYAKFDDQQYQVVFYESDLTTICQESLVYYGASVTAPTIPVKPSTASFDYLFVSWSESFDLVTEDLVIFPIFDRIYKPETIYLLPGIDTVFMGEEWIDSGTSLEDQLLTVDIRSSIDTEIAGSYILFYDIYDTETLIDTRIRIIHVVEPILDVKIALNPDVTTIVQGETYMDMGAQSNYGEVTASGFVDIENAGTYVITYTVVYADQVYTKSKYVYVLQNIDNTIAPVSYYKKDEDGWLS